jgi:hypothetical protein
MKIDQPCAGRSPLAAVLVGRTFLICTDHYSLKHLLDQRLLTIPQHQWAGKLFRFDFTIEFKPEAHNVVADMFSHRDTEDRAEVATLSTPAFNIFDTLHAELDAVPNLWQLNTEVAARTHGEHWCLVDGLVVLKDRVYVPLGSPVVPDILTAVHGVGHEGTEKTLHMLLVDFHIPDVRTVVRDWVRKCGVCQWNKTEQLHPAGLLQPVTVPTTVWTDIAMKFIEGLPKVHGKLVILTVIDRFSKAAHFVSLGHPYTATMIARAFFDNIIKLHGIPSSIISDQDPVFTDRFWKELFGLAGVTL